MVNDVKRLSVVDEHGANGTSLVKYFHPCRVLSLSDRRYSLNPLSQTRID